MDISILVDKIASLPPASIVVAVAAVVIATAYFILSSKGVPPGPTGLPYFGYWPFIRNKVCQYQLDALKKKYGDVFSFTCCGRLYINLGSAKAIREAHITKADYFGARVQEFSILSVTFEDGIAFANGEPWKEMRKFFVRLLKERGVTTVKDTMTDSMYESVHETVEHLRALDGQPENIVLLLTDKCNAILRHTLFGETGISEEQVREINELYGMVTELMTPSDILVTGKFAKFLCTFVPRYRRGIQNIRKIEKIIYKMIDDHKSSYNEDHIRDIIDEYIKERKLRRSKGDPTAEYFTDKALMASLVQFIGDGVISVAVFITLFLKNVIDHPEEQEQMFQELLEVVGEDRDPTVDDKTKLPYCNAFIQEVLRQSDFFPFFPSQECTKETTVRGYRIPVGAITLTNFWSSHFDPEVYDDPQKFDPSRFISKDGGKRAELPITFGIGRRSCIGEGFTMTQVFLFLTALVKNFNLSLNKGPKDLLLEMFTGEVKMIAAPRKPKN